MPSDNLNIPFVTTSQNQKELTINDAINALDNALNSSLDITITTDRTLTAAEFTSNVIFNLTGTPAGAFNLVIPATERLFAVRNNTGQTATVKYAASGSFPISTGDAALIHSSGAAIVGLGSGGGGGSAITVQDEGVSLTTAVTKFNFIGAGITVSEPVANEIEVNVPGGSSFTGGTLTSALNEAPITTLASSTTTNIGAEAANTISISGTITITSFGTIASGAKRLLVFQASLTLTHNATSLILPTGANIITQAGDVAEFVSLGSGNWRCTGYERADGTALVGASTFVALSDTPANYTGHSLKRVRVNAGATGLEFIVDSFLNLSDTPSSFSGAALYKVRVNAGGTALEFVEDVATSGTDSQARAGATRFVVPGTYADPSGADVSRNALRVNAASSDARALNAAITGLSGATTWSGYIEFNFATLPATGSVAPLYAENFSAGDSLIYLEVRPDGSIAINSDKFFTEVATAAGVIVTGTNYKVAPIFDFSAPGQPIKLFINGVNEITDVAGADLAAFAANVSYRAGAFGPATADGVYSRAAIWSGLLSDAEAIALTEAGDPEGFAPATATLRAYWKLDEGTGTTAVATVGGVNMTLTGAGAGWSTILGAPASGTIVRVASSSATGDFATHENDLALKVDAGWTFLDPVEGWDVYDQTTNIETRWNGTAWAALPSFTGGTLTSALNEAPATTLASAGSLNIGAEAANTINITGTTTITALGTIADGATRRLVFAAALTLTHNATSLILPTGANITTAAGDVAEFVSLGAGNWKCIDYQRADGTALSGGGSFTGGTLTSALNEAPPTTLASGATTDIGAEAANTINISGTTTITSFGTIAAGAVRRLVFQGILTLTHNATSLILPTGANIVTAADDVAEFVSLGAGNWRCTDYRRASGAALSGGGSFTGGTLTSALNEAPITTLASASSIDIGAEAANTISISGTTTITALGTIASGAVRRLVFQGALTLTHNATSLILPTGANITTAAGDVAEFVSLGSGNWRCFNYQRASGAALLAGAVALPIQEEGVEVVAAPTAINFVGAGATVTDVAGVATVTISGGGGASIEVQDEGVSLTSAVALFNFAGAGVTVTEPVADQVLVTIPGGGGSGQVGLASQLPSNGYYIAHNFDSPTWSSDNGITQDAMIMWPFYLDSDATFDGLEMNVTTASATQVVDVNIYEFLGNGLPGAALLSANVPVTATGVVAVGFTPVGLTAGWHFLGIHAAVASAAAFWGVSSSGTEGNQTFAAVLISDLWTAIATATEFQSRRVPDASLVGGTYTIGGDLTGTTLTIANTAADGRCPTVFLVKA